MSRQCWKCRITVEEYNIHHINGNHSDNKIPNKIRLCPGCHDLIEGICAKCQSQKNCFLSKFEMCWHFEENLPPIYFRPQSIINDQDNQYSPINPVSKALNAFNYRLCAFCIKVFYPKNPNDYSDMFCPNCLIKLIKKQTPDKWNLLQEWKKEFDGTRIPHVETPKVDSGASGEVTHPSLRGN